MLGITFDIGETRQLLPLIRCFVVSEGFYLFAYENNVY